MPTTSKGKGTPKGGKAKGKGSPANTMIKVIQELEASSGRKVTDQVDLESMGHEGCAQYLGSLASPNKVDNASFLAAESSSGGEEPKALFTEDNDDDQEGEESDDEAKPPSADGDVNPADPQAMDVTGTEVKLEKPVPVKKQSVIDNTTASMYNADLAARQAEAHDKFEKMMAERAKKG